MVFTLSFLGSGGFGVYFRDTDAFRSRVLGIVPFLALFALLLIRFLSKILLEESSHDLKKC